MSLKKRTAAVEAYGLRTREKIQKPKYEYVRTQKEKVKSLIRKKDDFVDEDDLSFLDESPEVIKPRLSRAERAKNRNFFD
jgi:hypothetical protein